MALTRRQFFRQVARTPATETASLTHFGTSVPFFRSYTHPTPRIHPDFWSLSVGGQVRYPMSLSLADVLALPGHDLDCTIVCAANPPGGERIGHARWHGIRMADVLNEVDIDSGARFAHLEAVGGQHTVVRLQDLRRGLLAWAMNGDLLRPDDGYPARLVIPGLYDHKQPRWLTRIELRAEPGSGGNWEARGYDSIGQAATTSGMTAPHPFDTVGTPVALLGYAYAGLRTITAIELSIDGGPWTPVMFTPSTPGVWTRWQTTWPAPGPGAYRVAVRATDSAGFTQTGDSGASAIHRVTIHVTDDTRLTKGGVPG